MRNEKLPRIDEKTANIRLSNRDFSYLRNFENNYLIILKFLSNILFSNIFTLIKFFLIILQFWAIYRHFRFRGFKVLKGVILGFKD
jgi:hypothetical protein